MLDFGTLHYDISDRTQYVNGSDANDTFVMDGPASDFGWAPTRDGTGIVIWRIGGTAEQHNILTSFDYIRFNDGYVNLADTGLALVAETPWNETVDYGTQTANIVGQTQYLQGSDETETFVIDGSSTDYGWSKTNDGTGLVVWPLDGSSDQHNIVWNYNYVKFNDGHVDLSSDTPVFVANGTANRPPVAFEDMATTDVNTAVVINVLENDVDLDGDPLSIHSYNDGENGTVARNADGTLTYTPNDGFVGTDYFHYCVTDGKGGISGTTVKVVIEDGEIPGDASVGDFVWNDANGNGVQDTGEAGIEGVKVELLDTAGNVVQTTTTASNGFYLFEDVEAGDYRVRFEKASGFEFTDQDAGTNDFIDSDADQSTGLTEVFTVDSGEYVGHIDAGMVGETEPEPGSIGDRVFIDNNEDGVFDAASETGAANVTVRLLNGAGTEVARTTTDANGNYKFDDLAAGEYRIQVEAPDGYLFTTKDAGSDDSVDSDVDQTNGTTDIITLAAGQNIDTVDAGIVKEPELGSIGDQVFIDTNEDGVFDAASETGAANVTVRLLNGAGTEVARTTTDANGVYKFDDLEAGEYRVQVEAPDGYLFTTKDAGSDDSVDSDVDQTSGTTDIITLAAGQNIDTVDAGIVKEEEPETGSIGDRVWYDKNRNGVQDAGEEGISDVTVILKDENGTEIERTTTDTNGNYLFDDLEAGKYAIGIEAPDGYEATIQDADEIRGERTLTVDSVSQWRALGVRTNGVQVNVGTGYNATLQGITFNREGTDSSNSASIEIPLGGAAGATERLGVDLNVFKQWATSYGGDGSAKARFELVDANGTVLDTVNWVSKNGTQNVYNDTNTANDQTVHLEGFGEGLFIRVTDQSNVTYRGDDFLIDSLSVEAHEEIANDDTNDSDIDPQTLMTENITLAEGEDNLTVDAGLVKEVDYTVKIVGVDCIHEGDKTNAYHVELSKTVTEDTWVRVNINDGTAKQTISGDELKVVRVAKSNHVGATGDLLKAGEVYAYSHWINTDFYVGFADENHRRGDPDTSHPDIIREKYVEVLIKAGSSKSESFNIGAILENSPWESAPREGNEHFELEVVRVGYDTELKGETDLTVEIKDRFIYTPVALDLNGDGEIGVTGETTSRDKDADAELGRTVEFDIDADGEIETIEWFDGSGDGILVDMTKIGEDGSIDGSALFGDEGGKFANGYEKLALHDANGDGVISGEELEGLGVWIDDGDAVLEAGELKSAAEAGITSINSDFEIEYDEAGRSYIRSEAEVDGKTVLTEDVWFAADQSADIVEQVKSDEDDQMLANAGTEECVFCTA